MYGLRFRVQGSVRALIKEPRRILYGTGIFEALE